MLAIKTYNNARYVADVEISSSRPYKALKVLDVEISTSAL